MTPGPASRMVTELPRKSPTPIAPPIVIMVSWRCVSLRFSSEELSDPLAAASLEGIDACSAAGCLLTSNQFTKYFAELVNLLDSVVVDQRRTVDAGVEAFAQAPHQPRCVHVSVANADA